MYPRLNQTGLAQLGACFNLAARFEPYREYPVYFFVERLAFPIAHGQSITSFRAGRCEAFITWACISDEVLAMMQADPNTLFADNQWKCGEIIYVGDMIAEGPANSPFMFRLLGRMVEGRERTIYWGSPIPGTQRRQFRVESSVLPSVKRLHALRGAQLAVLDEVDGATLDQLGRLGQFGWMAAQDPNWRHTPVREFSRAFSNEQVQSRDLTIEWQDDGTCCLRSASGHVLITAPAAGLTRQQPVLLDAPSSAGQPDSIP